MIIYNVTINVDDSIHAQWREWIKEHIPQGINFLMIGF